jgi:myo-inositol-1(or 4)-monophosphatase
MRKFAVDLAKRAGNILAANFRKDSDLPKIRSTVKDIVTRYDEMVDEFITKEITQHYPDHNILTEESGATNKGSRYGWIVDPLDGTVNFACGNPFFCVNLAVLKDDTLLLGVTYAPSLGELFVAERGKGAFLNGERISISSVGDLQHSYVFMCEGKERNRTRTGRINAALYTRVRDLRKLGSAGIEAAWVACGRGDAYVTPKIESWDIAAGVLLVQEAGGKVTDFKGKEWEVRPIDLILSNGKVHEQVRSLVEDL